jgi:hypothetical protein
LFFSCEIANNLCFCAVKNLIEQLNEFVRKRHTRPHSKSQ